MTDEQAKQKKLKDKARETIDLFNEYEGGDKTQWNTDISEDIEFVNNAQWEISIADSLEAANQPVVVNNIMKPARDQVVQQLTDNEPRWIALPREKSDAKMAGMYSDLGSYIWDTSNSNMHFRKATEDFTDTGYFILHAYYDPDGDYGKGEIKICRINPLKFYPDPQCTLRNVDDAENLFLSDILSKSRISYLYPNFDFNGASEFSKSYFIQKRKSKEGQTFAPKFLKNQKYYRVIDRYQKIKIQKNWVYDPNSNFEKVFDDNELELFLSQPAVVLVKMGEEKIVTQESEINEIKNMAAKYGMVFHFMNDGSVMPGVEGQGYVDPMGRPIMPIQGSTTKVHFGTMGNLLEEGKIKVKKVPVERIKRTLVIGEKLYAEMIMPITRYPFGITMLHHTDTPYPYGDTRITKAIQEQINKVKSLIIAYNINITNVKVILDETANIKDFEEKWGKAGAQFFRMDMENGKVPVIVQLQTMNSALYEQLDRDKFLIQRIYGVYEFQDGNVSVAPQTKGGTAMLDEFGYRRSRSKLKLIEGALNDLGAVISEMIPYTYTDRKTIRLIEPNNKSKESVFNDIQADEYGKISINNDLTVNRYDLRIQSGSTLPTNMQQRFENKLRLWELQLMRNPEPILRESGLPDVEEIIQSEDKLKEAEQIINQLQEAVKDYEGQLQTKSREVIHANEQIEVEKFKTKLNSISSKLEQSQLLSQYRLNDLVKDKKQQQKTRDSKGE